MRHGIAGYTGLDHAVSQSYAESMSAFSLPDVALRRRRHTIAFAGLLWMFVPLYCALTVEHLGVWALALLFAAAGAAVGHERLSRAWPVEKRGTLDVDASGLWFRGVRIRQASAFYWGAVNGPLVRLRSHYPLGDLEIVAVDVTDARRILSTLNVRSEKTVPQASGGEHQTKLG